MKNTVHKTVLLKETIDSLDLQDGDVVVDATLNAGGHSLEALSRAKDIKVIGLDADADALVRAKTTLQKFLGQSTFVESNFRDLKKALKDVSPDKFIFDLGLSSDQLEASGRGFSFQKDEPLLMTFAKNPKKGELTARDVVNGFEEKNLEAIIRGFGEEQFAGRIARAIREAREKKPIETSKELAQIISNVVPGFYRKGKIHPATKTFQAIRMAVNSEIDTLKTALNDSFEILNPGGRIAVITFHSGEDRIVKNFFKSLKENGEAEIIFKKPLTASREEIKTNPRSRSAKLRVIKKLIIKN